MIDGEAVVLDRRHRRFQRLHSRKHNHEVQLYAFDILALDGEGRRDLPLGLRKTNLERRLARRPDAMMLVEKRAAIRTLRGWATSVLLEAGAISECEEHGWMIDRADPHAHDRAFDIARRDPPPGVSPKAAAIAIAEVLKSIGDTCPECTPD